MKTILAATLVVRVLGLATVTDQVPNDCGVHVIVPRVDSTAHAGHDSPHVEAHTAMLVVPTDQYDPASTWKMKPMPAYPEYMYLELDGDSLRVITNGTNPAPSLKTVRLPSLQGCCAAAGPKKKLRPAFQAPYTGAAAVLDVTGGKVVGCRAPAKGENQFRYDTEIFVNHGGTAKISGDTMKERKEVRLRNLSGPKPAVVYLANVPSCFPTNTCQTKAASAPDGLSHVHAYYSMLQGDTSQCTPTMKKCPVTGGQPPKCVTPMIASTAPLAFDFECSNTQYP
jgi:hypothetical protein